MCSSKKGQVFSLRRCDRTQRTTSVTPLLRTTILMNIYARLSPCFRSSIRDMLLLTESDLATLLENSKAVAQSCSVKNVFLEISQNSQESTCARVSFFNKVAGLKTATLLKQILWHRCVPVNFAKFLGTPFFTEHLR